MSNRFGRRAQGPPAAQGPQDQYGPEQEAQGQYGSRPPQGTQEQYGGRQPQGTQEQYGGRPPQGTQEQYVPRPSPGYEAMREREGAPAARGEARPKGMQWHGHGGGLAMLTGILAFLVGLAHVISRAFFAFTPAHYAYAWSGVGWGVVQLVLGAVLFVAGAAAITGLAVTRMVGAAVAILTAIAFFMFIPYSPVWSIVIVALCAACVWTLLAPRQAARI
jgi:hypothetical protein